MNNYKEDKLLELLCKFPEKQVKQCIRKSIAKFCNEYTLCILKSTAADVLMSFDFNLVSEFDQFDFFPLYLSHQRPVRITGTQPLVTA